MDPNPECEGTHIGPDFLERVRLLREAHDALIQYVRQVVNCNCHYQSDYECNRCKMLKKYSDV